MRENAIQTKSFALAMATIDLYKRLQSKREYVISRQLLRSGTSVGANVEEANAGQSRKDFLSKMSVASKEARETKYWLRLLETSKLVDLDVSSELAMVEEVIRLLTSIVKTTSQKSL